MVQPIINTVTIFTSVLEDMGLTTAEASRNRTASTLLLRREKNSASSWRFRSELCNKSGEKGIRNGKNQPSGETLHGPTLGPIHFQASPVSGSACDTQEALSKSFDGFTLVQWFYLLRTKPKVQMGNCLLFIKVLKAEF